MNLPFPIPIEVLYAGLAGTLLSLFIATWQQNWQCKVFFLLALRLAIGWHFLFEGLYKVHSYYTGPNDTTKVFTSEPYFKVAPGPLGSTMRKQFDDPQLVIETKVKPPKEMTAEAFAKLTLEEQAAACPDAVAKSLDSVRDKTEEAIKEAAVNEINAAATEATLAIKAKPAEEAKAKAKAEAIRVEAQKKIDAAKELAAADITEAKAAYARWVYSVAGRDTKVKGITGDAKLSASQRLEHLVSIRKELKTAEQSASAGLGNGYGTASKKAAELRMDLLTAETDLAKDANAYVAEMRKNLTSGKALAEEPPAFIGPLMDRVTMWFLVAVGTGLLAGFVCRLWCVLGAGFLVVTYLNHPPFPWFPLPPGTEGNPVFVNKNIIECLALLSLACMPTGRWLGLDALFLGVPRDPNLVKPTVVVTKPAPAPRTARPDGRG